MHDSDSEKSFIGLIVPMKDTWKLTHNTSYPGESKSADMARATSWKLKTDFQFPLA